MRIESFLRELDRFFPFEFAEPWDQVGLLVGGAQKEVERVFFCLTLTKDVLEEAIDWDASLILTHHPILFKGVQRILQGNPSGDLIHKLMCHNLAVASFHTSFDNGIGGIHDQMVEFLNLQKVQSLEKGGGDWKKGRLGLLPQKETVRSLSKKLKALVGSLPFFLIHPEKEVQSVALACGSGRSFLKSFFQEDCDVFVTGELNFHDSLTLREFSRGGILLGHFASESFSLVKFAKMVEKKWDLPTRVSERESNPWEVLT